MFYSYYVMYTRRHFPLVNEFEQNHPAFIIYILMEKSKVIIFLENNGITISTFQNRFFALLSACTFRLLSDTNMNITYTTNLFLDFFFKKKRHKKKQTNKTEHNQIKTNFLFLIFCK